MARLQIDAGRLRHRLQIERPTMPAGGSVSGAARFTAGDTVFALVEPLGPLGAEETGFALDARRLAVTIRFRPGVASGQRFRLGDRLLVIETAFDPDETGRFIRCLCREEGP